jgi:hypothetical protein
MKRTALVSVAFCASVMASGCAGESLEGFDQEALDQESIGSVQQGVTPDVGDWVDINWIWAGGSRRKCYSGADLDLLWSFWSQSLALQQSSNHHIEHSEQLL